MAEHPIQGIMNVTMDKIHEMVDANTIIGKAITTEDGTTILPVSRISFGFASAGTDFDGKNTANIVRVEAITEIATSFVACTAACFGWLPRSIWVVTFSNTTIASSTTMPIAIESELNEIMFNVLPEASK